jgi:hypothetical protein
VDLLTLRGTLTRGANPKRQFRPKTLVALAMLEGNCRRSCGGRKERGGL